MTEWIARTQALALLNVKPQTLYAYVSRGLVEMQRDPAQPGSSLYRQDDVQALAQRRTRSRQRSAIAAGSMAWGEASIVTAISTVRRGRLIYRGQDASQLAATATLEDAARLLWDSACEIRFPVPATVFGTPFQALAAAVAGSVASAGQSAEGLCQDARLAIGALASGCNLPPGESEIHQGLASLWGLDAGHAERVRQALVLLADHELNASTFAARVAASTGAPIAACLLAGLCALSGPRHGGASAAVLRLLAENRSDPEGGARAWLDRHGFLPGFGHPLYPDGDLRAMLLLERMVPDPLMRRLQDYVLETSGKRPNIDFALAGLTRSAGLPSDAAFTIFILGRSIGWAAHAMEQAGQETLIRPRARYAGALPAG